MSVFTSLLRLLDGAVNVSCTSLVRLLRICSSVFCLMNFSTRMGQCCRGSALCLSFSGREEVEIELVFKSCCAG